MAMKITQVMGKPERESELDKLLDQYLFDHGWTRRDTGYGQILWTRPSLKNYWMDPRTEERSDNEMNRDDALRWQRWLETGEVKEEEV
jgi:hypothetical protein